MQQMNKNVKRKELIDKLKKQNKINDDDYFELDKDLEKLLKGKKAKLISLLFERELLKREIEKKLN